MKKGRNYNRSLMAILTAFVLVSRILMGGSMVRAEAETVDAPVITTQPKDASVTVGETAKFTIAASGRTPLTYQWQSRKDASGSWANSGKSGAKTATLSVGTTLGLHGWQFRCIVTGADGKSTVSDTVSVKVAPKITKQPQDTNVEYNHMVHFSVEVYGKEPLYYGWQYWDPSSADWKNTGIYGVGMSEYEYYANADWHGRRFRCVVTDGNGQKAYSEEAVMQLIPTIWDQSMGSYSTVGTTKELKVSAKGFGTLKYQWQSRKDAGSTWSNSGLTGAKTQTLSVPITPGLDGWQFRCIVTDANEMKNYSNTYDIDIINSMSPPNDTYAEVGSTVQLKVSMSGKSPFTYQWQSRKDPSAQWKNSGMQGAKTNTLTIPMTAGLHGWQFRVIVTDRKGGVMISAPATLVTHLALTEPVMDRYSPLGWETLFFACAEGKGKLTYQWQSRKDDKSAWSNSAQEGSNTYVLQVPTTKGLNGWQFRCIITDESGASITSNVARLLVVADIYEDPLDITVNAGSVAEFSVEAEGTGQLKYQWQSRKDHNSVWSNSAQEGAKTPTLSVKATAGLNGWQFRCLVTDAFGNQAESDYATLTVTK
ncbi:MAG: hypothetical protein IK125_02255 [Lachnospiraceae bacterium]|nr:hypothetical protein [Lachnospiraceae bacterium]